MPPQADDPNLLFPEAALYRLGLNGQPFAEPPGSLFEDTARATQLNVILSLLQSGERIVVLEGGTGLGKTTLLQQLAKRRPPGLSARLLTGAPSLATEDLWGELVAVAEGDHASTEPSSREQALNHIRGARRGGLHPALLIDDAHALRPAAAEALLEFWRELDETEEAFSLALALDPAQRRPWNEARLPQERIHLAALHPFTEEQTSAYLEHRLACVGAPPGLLSDTTKHAIHEASGGHPRHIHTEAYRFLTAQLTRPSAAPAPSIRERLRRWRRPLLLASSGAIATAVIAGGGLMLTQSQLHPSLLLPWTEGRGLRLGSSEDSAERQQPQEEANPDEDREDESGSSSSPPANETETLETEETPFGLELPGRYSFREDNSVPTDGEDEDGADAPSLQLLDPRPATPGSPREEETEEGSVESEATDADAPWGEDTTEEEDDEEEEDKGEENEGEEEMATEADDREGNADASPEPEVLDTAAAAEWVRGQADGRYTIQVLAASNAAMLRRYAEAHEFSGQAAIARTQRNGEDWFVLLYGAHADRADAEEALADLPTSITERGAWIRSFASLAEQLAPDRE
ncbi:MAG: AAA family ATPase [Halorhodospira sp.]